MATLNVLTLIGYAGADAEMRYTPGGEQVSNFRLAVGRRWTDGKTGEIREHTEWYNCTVWGKQAEAVSQYVTRGKQVYVEGRHSSRTWVGKDGQNRFSNEVHVNRVLFLGSGKAAAGDDDGAAAQADAAYPNREAVGVGGNGHGPTPDDLPF